MKTRLSRRTLLRGVLGSTAVGLALPSLEAMVGEKVARAADAYPVFGLFFWGGGLPWNDKHGAEQAGHADLWTPASEGALYAPSTLLEPLAPYQPSIVTGLTPHTDVPPTPPGQEDGHMRGFMVAMTGDRIRPEGFDHPSHTLTALRPTLDQYVAKHPDFYPDGVPKFSSLVLGISPARFHEYGHWNHISYNGPDSTNPPIMDPTQLFNLLFSVPPDVDLLKRRASLLDAVMEDGKDLKKRLGASDKLRLDEHLDHMDEIQRRLELSGAVCEIPAVPGNSDDIVAKTDISRSNSTAGATIPTENCQSRRRPKFHCITRTQLRANQSRWCRFQRGYRKSGKFSGGSHTRDLAGEQGIWKKRSKASRSAALRGVAGGCPR